MSINRDLWLSAIEDVSAPLVKDDPNAVTTREFAALYECGYTTAQHRLRALKADGRVESVSKWVIDSGGRRLRVPAWRLVQPKPVKKRRK